MFAHFGITEDLLNVAAEVLANVAIDHDLVIATRPTDGEDHLIMPEEVSL
jgi:hypothetical protein